MDRTTTPRWAQGPATLLLFGLAMYFLGCFHFVMSPDMPRWAAVGNWKMFTEIDHTHDLLTAQALRDGAWVDVDLDALFPSQWDSGPRYSRAPFRQNSARVKILADSTCQRLHTDPERVRIIHTAWKVTLGSVEQPRTSEQREVVLDWRCGDKVPRPKPLVRL